jgi:hypothetical protein
MTNTITPPQLESFLGVLRIYCAVDDEDEYGKTSFVPEHERWNEA